MGLRSRADGRGRRALRAIASARRVAAALVLAACAKVPGGGPAGSPEASIAARVTAPLGVALVSACVPTGPEICFNATDDNCNGVLDEGCGLTTGALQFMIAWADSPADVDLVVVGPTGERVTQSSRSTPSGLHLDRDCPADGCQGQNVENVYFDGGEPLRGRYLVEVVLDKLQGARPPVAVRFGARVGSRSYGADIELIEERERKVFEIVL